MGPHEKPNPEAPLKRASAVVRAWDGPNSRIAFEMDLDQMPWGPFEALGKRVTVLVPASTRGDENGAPEEGTESQIERALRHVEHAAAKCAEFADLGDGGDQLWRTSLDTWEWLRDYLTAQWMEGGSEGTEEEDGTWTGSTEAALRMPGAAAILEVVATALRQAPLSVWREAVGPYNPDAPTREEAIQTLLGVARLLGGSAGATSPRASAGPTPPEDAAAEATPPSRADTPSAPAASPPPAGAEEPADQDDDLSFDYAAGFDEGYRMGRRVGRALAARNRSRGG